MNLNGRLICTLLHKTCIFRSPTKINAYCQQQKSIPTKDSQTIASKCFTVLHRAVALRHCGFLGICLLYTDAWVCLCLADDVRKFRQTTFEIEIAVNVINLIYRQTYSANNRALNHVFLILVLVVFVIVQFGRWFYYIYIYIYMFK